MEVPVYICLDCGVDIRDSGNVSGGGGTNVVEVFVKADDR